MRKIFIPRSIAVVGAGPVGCVVAASLATSGYDVTLCDRNPNMVASVVEPGISIEGAMNLKQAVTRKCNSVTDFVDIKPDVIFLAVKSYDLPDLVQEIKEFFQDGMYVVSWQNGIDTELLIANVLGPQAVLRGVVNYGGALLKPGHVDLRFNHTPCFIQVGYRSFE